MLLLSRLLYSLLMITVIWCRIFLLRLLTMRQFLHQLKVLSLIYMLLASSYSLVYLISWGQLSMRLTRIRTRVLSTMGLLKLLKRVVYSVFSQFSCFAWESPLLVFSFSGRIAKYNNSPSRHMVKDEGTYFRISLFPSTILSLHLYFC